MLASAAAGGGTSVPCGLGSACAVASSCGAGAACSGGAACTSGLAAGLAADAVAIGFGFTLGFCAGRGTGSCAWLAVCAPLWAEIASAGAGLAAAVTTGLAAGAGAAGAEAIGFVISIMLDTFSPETFSAVSGLVDTERKPYPACGFC